jgi:hypothetical protein
VVDDVRVQQVLQPLADDDGDDAGWLGVGAEPLSGEISAEIAVSVRAGAAACRSVWPGDAPSNKPFGCRVAGLPCDQRASSSACASRRSAISLRTRLAQGYGPGTGEASMARRALMMVARVSAWQPSAHWLTTAPVAGLTDSEMCRTQSVHRRFSAWRPRSCAGFFGRLGEAT